MADKNNKLKSIVATFILLIVGLALTPSVASFTTDATYQETITLIPFGSPIQSTSGGVAIAPDTNYTIRNVTATIHLTLYNAADNATVTGFTFVVTDSKQITISDLGDTQDYWGSITYQTSELTSAASLALVGIIPLAWVVLILAIGIVAIRFQLKTGQGG